MALPRYFFFPDKGETPDSVAKQRRVAEALMGRAIGQAPRNVGEGLASLGNALAFRFAMNRIDKAETAGRGKADQAMDKVARALIGNEKFPSSPSSELDPVAAALYGKRKPDTSKAGSTIDFANAEDSLIPDSYYAATRASESGGDRFAKNPRSSATGDFQFISSTWSNLAKRRPDLGLTPDGRTDPDQSMRAMRAFTEENATSLAGSGLPVNGGTLYGSHFLGVDGAKKVFQADPTTPMSQLVSSAVIRANPFLNGMTAADFGAWASRKGGGDAGFQQRPPSNQVASLDPAAGLPASDPYGAIPAIDGEGEDQRAKFRQWNSDPAGNEAANLQQIDPALRGVIERAKQIAGQDFVLGSGRRTPDQQRQAMQWGWSKTEDSDHLGGGAADLWPLDDQGQVVFDPQRQQQIVAAMKQAAGELGVDMEAGADWKRFRDAPHFGMTNQTPLDGAPVPTPRPGQDTQVASLDPAMGLPRAYAPERQAPVMPMQPGQEPRQTVRAPSATNPATMPSGPMRMADAGQMSDEEALGALGAREYDPAQERMRALMNAYRQPWLSDNDRAMVADQIQRIQQEQAQALRFAREEAQRSQDRSWQLQDRSAGWEREDAIRQADRLREENDPVRALQLRKAQLEIAAAERGEGNVEFKVVNDRLIKTFADGRPPEDVTPEAPAGSGPAGPFSGNSVEAQSLNWLVENGKLTPEQAAQVGAGKPITDPSTGAIMFMTPQGIFSQQPGQPAQPVQSGGGSRLLSPSPLGQGSSPVQPPQPVPAETPRREGMIPLTPPKERPVPDATRNKVANVNQAFDAIGAELDRYAELVGKTGIEAVPGDSKDNLNTVRQGIMLQMKELFNLGVLNGPDLALMERMIYDPVVDPFKDGGLRNLPDQLYTAATGGAGERAVNSVTELKRMLTNIRDTTNRAAGTTQGAPAGRSVGGDAELEDLLRKYGG